MARISTDVLFVLCVAVAGSFVAAPFFKLFGMSVGSGGEVLVHSSFDAWGRVKTYDGGEAVGHPPRYGFVLCGLAAVLLLAAAATAVTRTATWPLLLARVGSLAGITLAVKVAVDLILTVRVASSGDNMVEYSTGLGGFLAAAAAVACLAVLVLAGHVARVRRRARPPRPFRQPRTLPVEARLAAAFPWLAASAVGVGGCFLTLWQRKGAGGFFRLSGLGTVEAPASDDRPNGIVAFPYIALWGLAAVMMVVGVTGLALSRRDLRWTSVGLYGTGLAGLTCWLMVLEARSFKSPAAELTDLTFTYENGLRLTLLAGGLSLLGAAVAGATEYVRFRPPAVVPPWQASGAYTTGPSGYHGGSGQFPGGPTAYPGGPTGYAGGSTGYAGGSSGYAGGPSPHPGGPPDQVMGPTAYPPQPQGRSTWPRPGDRGWPLPDQPPPAQPPSPKAP